MVLVMIPSRTFGILLHRATKLPPSTLSNGGSVATLNPTFTEEVAGRATKRPHHIEESGLRAQGTLGLRFAAAL